MPEEITAARVEALAAAARVQQPAMPVVGYRQVACRLAR
jgi:hypothetical protein